MDVYLWKAPFEKPTIAPYVEVRAYRFVLKKADGKTVQRVKAAIKKDFGAKCGYNVAPTWPIYQYDLGKDGKLLVSSCKITSFDSWSVYYQLTPKNSLRLLRFQFPVLNKYSKDSNKIPPKIVGYEERTMLKNSDILQQRLLTKSSLRDKEFRNFRTEWIWKEKHGFTLMKHAFVVFDRAKKTRETILYP